MTLQDAVYNVALEQLKNDRMDEVQQVQDMARSSACDILVPSSNVLKERSTYDAKHRSLLQDIIRKRK